RVNVVAYPGRNEAGGSTNVAFNHDGSRLATTSIHGGTAVKLWDAATGRQIQALDQGEGYSLVACSPKGTWVAAIRGLRNAQQEDSATVQVWNAATGKTRHVLRGGYTRPITCLAFSPDERLLAAGGIDNNRLTLWDVATGVPVATYPNHEGGVAGVSFQ